MANAVEIPVDKYIRAARERDPAVRAKLIEECFAPDGRLVARQSVIRGRAELAAAFERFLANPNVLGFRVVSAIDAQGTTFRVRSVVDHRDGSQVEFFDAGEVDASGRIVVLLTFAGPLADAVESPLG